MILDQGHHQQCHGPGCGRDHSGSATDKGDHHGDTERGVQADLGVNPGNDRESDGFRDEGQCDHNTGEDVATDVG